MCFYNWWLGVWSTTHWTHSDEKNGCDFYKGVSMHVCMCLDADKY